MQTNKQIIKNLSTLNNFTVKAIGSSMEPLLFQNDILYCQKSAFNKILINDLVIVKKATNIIAHRVIYRDKKTLVTRGDNNMQIDGRFTQNQIIGKVYQIKRAKELINPENLYLIQSTLYFNEIVSIKNQFDRKKINYVFLKGLPLYLYYEGNHPKRIYADCDVLIEKKFLDRVKEVMTRSGYKVIDPSLTKLHKKLRKKQIEIAYKKVVNGFFIIFDIHLEIDWMSPQIGKLGTLYPQSSINQLTENFLKVKRSVKINNEKFSILNTKYLILYLALHLLHHNLRGAFRYRLLDKIIRREKLSNNMVKYLAETIKKYRLQNFVHPVFVLLKKYYKTPVPNPFLKQIKPKNLVNFKNLSIFNDEPRIYAGITRFKNLFFLSPEPWWKKIWVFINPQVIYSIFWVLQKKVFSFFQVPQSADQNPR